MKAIVFDVDDTLYDLSTPFKETCREVFPEVKDLDLEGAFWQAEDTVIPCMHAV